MKLSKNHRLGIALIAAFTLLAGGAQATHWPQAGADQGRSGNQPGDQATLPLRFRNDKNLATQTSPLITAGATLADQRVVMTHFDTDDAENRNGRVGLYNFATFVGVGTGPDIDDEAPRDGLPNDQTVDPDQFGPVGDVVPMEASTHTQSTASQIYVVHNDDNQSTFNPTAPPAQQMTPNPNGNDIAIAQVDGVSGDLKRDQFIGSASLGGTPTTQGMTVESAPVMGPDSGGEREVYFFASKTANNVTTKHLVKVTIANASSNASNAVTLNAISPNIADLNVRARPALVTFVDPDGGSSAPMVALPTNDGVKTIRAADPGLDDFGPSITGLGTTWTPSVPMHTNGIPPTNTPFFYVASSTAEGTVVRKLRQGSGDAAIGSFVLAESDGQSAELAGTPSPGLALAQTIPTGTTTAQPGRVIVATAANIYSLNTENLAGESPQLFGAALEKGFSKTIPATSGNLGFAVTDGGQQQVFNLTGPMKITPSEETFQPAPTALNSTSSFGQPAVSRGRVVFPANNALFTYGPNVAILQPQASGTVSGASVTLEAYVVNATFSNVVFKIDGTIVGSDNTLDANRASVVWNSQSVPDGVHLLTAEATDGASTEVSARRQIIVNNFLNPSAALTVSPNPGNVGQDVTLNASGSAPTPGENETIAKYEYEIDGDNDFNDVAQNAPIVKVQFTTPGSKTVRVRVTDSHGDTATADATFRVNAPPEFTLKATPNPATPGQTVEIDATATDSDGSIAKYEFDLDGNSTFELDNGTNPKVSKAFAATTAVSARVTDNEGGQTIQSVTVTLPPANKPPVASFIVAPNPAIANQDVGFSAAASKDPEGGPITKYEWDFDGNGTFDVSGTTPLVAHKFTTPGVFKVVLRVTDNAGLTGTTTVDVIVSAARCVALNRCTPRFTASVSPKRDRKLPYRFTTRGRVSLPTGVRSVDGCAGRVSVQVKRGKRTISNRRVRLRDTCRFTSTVTFRNRKRLGTSKTLKFSVRFLGNKVLKPRSTSVKTVRIG